MKNNNLLLYIVLGIFAVLGVFCMVMGVEKLATGIYAKASTDMVVAEITDISTYKNHRNEMCHSVLVDYNYDGVEYKDITLGVYIADMFEGKEIEILVHPEEPTNIKTTSQDAIDIISSLIVGPIFAAVGIIPICIMEKKRKRIKNLKSQGRYIYAIVDYVEMDKYHTQNKKHPYIAYCTHEDEVTGVVYKFKSSPMWENPYPVIKEGTRLRVYVDGQNYANHYVDVDSLF